MTTTNRTQSAKREVYEAVNYYVCPCEICRELMTFQQVRESVYWLPEMTHNEFLWQQYEGFEFRFAHRTCWKRLPERTRRSYRVCSYKGQEPRSMGQFV